MHIFKEKDFIVLSISSRQLKVVGGIRINSIAFSVPVVVM